jgi:hypothetical protein
LDDQKEKQNQWLAIKKQNQKMRIHKLCLLLSLLFLTSYALFAQDSSDQEKIKVLKEFYRAYTTEIQHIDLNSERLDSIEKKYCTQKLLDWWENEELNYDPFINAQDLNPELYKILNIYRDNSRENKFIVTYNYFENKPEYESKIELIVIRSGDGYKIDQILIE